LKEGLLKQMEHFAEFEGRFRRLFTVAGENEDVHLFHKLLRKGYSTDLVLKGKTSGLTYAPMQSTQLQKRYHAINV
jgi:hypothetical protein